MRDDTGAGPPPQRATSPDAGSPSARASRLRLVAREDATVIHVEGPVDAEVGDLLCEAVEAAVAASTPPCSVEVDLGAAEWCSAAGLGALAQCAQAGARVRGGIRFRVGTVVP